MPFIDSVVRAVATELTGIVANGASLWQAIFNVRTEQLATGVRIRFKTRYSAAARVEMAVNSSSVYTGVPSAGDQVGSFIGAPQKEAG